ncbi:MAG: hypothetical protein IJ657_07775 [Acidaminococcaceae bacterium]|nr:hypothetical protein [Acidaminococcaceae bacterium]
MTKIDKLLNNVKQTNYDFPDAPADGETQIATNDNQSLNYDTAPTDAEGVYILEDPVYPEEFGLKPPVPSISTLSSSDEKEDDTTVAYNIACELVKNFEFRNDENGLFVYNEATGVFEHLNKSGDFKGSIAYFVTNHTTMYQDRLKTAIFNTIFTHLRNSKRWSKKMPKVDDTKICLRNVVYDLTDGNGQTENIGAVQKHFESEYISVPYCKLPFRKPNHRIATKTPNCVIADRWQHQTGAGSKISQRYTKAADWCAGYCCAR